MTYYKIFQKVIKYEIIGGICADSEAEAIELAKKSNEYRDRIIDVRERYGCQQDDTGKLVEIDELVARRSKWY